MPYLDQAARQLGISEKTLRRWLKLMDPPIEPTKNAHNLRFKFISDEDVGRIREARREIEGLTSGQHINKYLDVALRAKSTEDFPPLASRSVTTLAPTPRPRSARTHIPKSQSEDLPPIPTGHVSRQNLGPDHNIPAATVLSWCHAGKIETLAGEYAGAVPGAFSVRDPVTPKGLQDFYRLAAQRSDFKPCDDCPHDQEQLAEGSEP